MEANEQRIYVAVKGVLVQSGRALIVKRADCPDTDGIGRWEFAGGTLEFGESPKQTLVREFREETGLTVTPSRVLYAAGGQMHPDYHIVIITYACVCEDMTPLRLSDEHSAYLWADGAQLRRYLAKDILRELDDNDLWGILAE